MCSGRFLALDKISGVRPISIGKTWRGAVAKAVLMVARRAVTTSCTTYNICAGLKGSIEAAIHIMQAEWDLHHSEEDWVFLLIGARNVFNEQEWLVMRPLGGRFIFNSYKH
jgi:hypothetical protein